MIEDLIPRLLGWVPVSWRRTIIGPPNKPSRAATFVHHLLNRLPRPKSGVMACYGPLRGYRMSVNWERFRSFAYGTWEPNVLHAVTSIVKPGMKIVDVGAHIGYYTLLFAKCVGPSGQVASFEPLPENFVSLQENVRLNHLQNVELFPEAVFSHTQGIVIHVPADMDNTGDASIHRIEGAKDLSVPTATLDSFCVSFGFRPDFVKIDVEGAEHDVLLGGQEMVANFRPKMLIELHHFDRNVDAHPVLDLLAQWAYDIKWIDRWDLTSHILAIPRPVAPLSS